MTIDKRDFDANRPLLQDINAGHDTNERNPKASRPGSRHSRSSADDVLGLRADDGLLSEVVEELVERDRLRMQKKVIRVLSFGWGVVTWYVIPYSMSSHTLDECGLEADSCLLCYITA
jgi:hypothetical protein